MAAAQGGLLARSQLAALGAGPQLIRRRVAAERWQELSPRVIAMFTGTPTPEQRLWLGVLHAEPERAVVAGVAAAALAGLRGWEREEIPILVPYDRGRPQPLTGFAFQRTRRDLRSLRSRATGVPRCRVEPAVLLFAARERSERSAKGVLAATVQQRLSDPTRLWAELVTLGPLRRQKLFADVLAEIAGGAQSVAELDVRRMCRRFGLAPPRRQVKRRDATGRVRFTDCEWLLADGRTLVLEVDGSFHMDVDHWEDDLARQRALAATDRVAIRCTSREVRDEPAGVARDLVRLGVPRAA